MTSRPESICSPFGKHLSSTYINLYINELKKWILESGNHQNISQNENELRLRFSSHIKVYKHWEMIGQIVIQTNYNLKIANN